MNLLWNTAIWVCLWSLVKTSGELQDPMLLFLPMSISYYLIVIKQVYKQ